MFIIPAFSQVGFRLLVDKYNPYVPDRTIPAWVQLPSDYTASKKYPLLMFIHGVGEGASPNYSIGLSDPGYIAGDYLHKIYNTNNNPAYLRERSWDGGAVNPKTGVYEKFIIISPQDIAWFEPQKIQYFLQKMVQEYSIDTNRIYLTGLSGGGAAIVEYSQGPAGVSSPVANSARPYLPPAIVPMSEASTYPEQSEANAIVADSIRVWGFGDPSGDVHGQKTKYLVDYLNIAKPGWARWTSYTGGHCCWNVFYDPNYTEQVEGVSMNIYSWMLQYSRGEVAQPQPPPIVSAGNNKTVNVGNTLLTGTATAGGTTNIASYAWTQISGAPATIVSPGSISTTVTNLTDGVYTFRLTVTQSDLQTAYADVTITVELDVLPIIIRQFYIRKGKVIFQ